MIGICKFALPLVLVGVAVGQGRLAVPAAFADAEAPGAFGVPGIGGTERTQFVIDASHLQALVGHQIAGLSFRRNTDWSDDLGPAQGQLVVRIGTSAASAASAQPDFAFNLSQGSEVFRGEVSAPAAGVVSGYVGWVSGQILNIPFSPTFTYTGGPLCIELDGVAGSTDDWWPVDGIEDRNSGRVRSVGNACGPRSALLGETAGVSAGDLVVGETVHFGFFGEPRSVAFVMFGDTALGQPIDLGIIGAPGCELHVLPFAIAPLLLSDAVAGQAFGGIGEFLLHLPSDAGLVGARFVVQWMELLAPGIATSNALICDLAPAMPGTGIATVWARPGNAPVVDHSSAPVLGLLWQ